MTAQIAILNKKAVAVASDSAATIANKKVYNSSNKIFKLSDSPPVGIMHYGNVDMCGVPIETLIKMYRDSVQEKILDEIEDYGREFMNFLTDREDIFPTEAQQDYAIGDLNSFLSLLRENITKEYKKKYLSSHKSKKSKEEKESRSVKELMREIAIKKIRSVRESWDKSDKFFEVQREVVEQFHNRNLGEIEKNIKTYFPEYMLDEEGFNNLRNLTFQYFYKVYYGSRYSLGLVFVGLGNKQIFPSLVEYSMRGVINNKPLYFKDRFKDIEYNKRSSIIPFAQHDVVTNFMNGISPEIKNYLDRNLELFKNNITNKISNQISKEITNSGVSDETASLIAQVVHEEIHQIQEGLKKEQWDKHTNKIVSAVSSLPPKEMANMAESLINITSLKSKVSLDIESVGGDIDVAVITKGDGFVWIKRKSLVD